MLVSYKNLQLFSCKKKKKRTISSLSGKPENVLCLSSFSHICCWWWKLFVHLIYLYKSKSYSKGKWGRFSVSRHHSLKNLAQKICSEQFPTSVDVKRAEKWTSPDLSTDMKHGLFIWLNLQTDTHWDLPEHVTYVFYVQ